MANLNFFNFQDIGLKQNIDGQWIYHPQYILFKSKKKYLINEDIKNKILKYQKIFMCIAILLVFTSITYQLSFTIFFILFMIMSAAIYVKDFLLTRNCEVIKNQ